jgi:death-on-curing protein
VIWIDLPEVLAIHARQLDEHGGASGVRDEGLLESALARPQQLFAYGEPDVFDLAAAYTAGIVQIHPFVDGNKRTGFVVGILFLELNGPTFTASEADATQAVLGLAAGEINDDESASWLRSNSTPI